MNYEPPKQLLRSPLRYPGGKSALYPYLFEVMKHNGLTGVRYFEPFAGGAGVALGLLSSNMASEILLNDADYHIYCFWFAVLNESDRFIEKIQNIEVSIEEWQKQKMIYSEVKKYSTFEIGFSAFYLNRCNRSGILAGAGPIGGYEQKGKWRLGARFNKDNLSMIISNIGEKKDRITIYNNDAVVFLKNKLPRGRGRDSVFVYIDPPYISSGGRLYLNFYSEEDHKKLASYLLTQTILKWVVTYDNHALIRELYYSCQKMLISLGYSLQSKQKGEELLIGPKLLQLPNNKKYNSSRWSIIEKVQEGGLSYGNL